jgi:thiol peroxidase
MAQITLKGKPVQTSGSLPEIGSTAPDFSFVKTDLSEVTLSSLENQIKILNIFPSIDTGTCAMSVRQFNKLASENPNTTIINISKDLPFAQKRFCGAEGIENAITGSVFRNDFSTQYGLEILDGPLKGLSSRSVIVLDQNNKIVHTEQVSETTEEPNYETALGAAKKI